MYSVEVTKNGPYLVKNLKVFRNHEGNPWEVKDSMIICRCGKSNTKPFCDGTHAVIGFKDAKDPERAPDRLDSYEGKDITIHDNRGVCSHYGACTTYSPKVFTSNEPWIDANGEEAEKTIFTIRKCPSGALSYTINGKLYMERPELKEEIITTKDGPYWIRGCSEFKDPDGNKPEVKTHFSVCRCGGSNNKPFCDGKHWYIKFKAD